jgi:hypothetical protein
MGNTKQCLKKNRCIRIVYANLFYIDILPGFQESALDINRIVVPDRSLKDWTPSNPKGYAEWFGSIFTLFRSINPSLNQL